MTGFGVAVNARTLSDSFDVTVTDGTSSPSVITPVLPELSVRATDVRCHTPEGAPAGTCTSAVQCGWNRPLVLVSPHHVPDPGIVSTVPHR